MEYMVEFRNLKEVSIGVRAISEALKPYFRKVKEVKGDQQYSLHRGRNHRFVKLCVEPDLHDRALESMNGELTNLQEIWWKIYKNL